MMGEDQWDCRLKKWLGDATNVTDPTHRETQVQQSKQRKKGRKRRTGFVPGRGEGGERGGGEEEEKVKGGCPPYFLSPFFHPPFLFFPFFLLFFIHFSWIRRRRAGGRSAVRGSIC